MRGPEPGSTGVDSEVGLVHGGADITDEARFNFSLSNRDDWRFNNLLAVNAKLVSILSLKASNVVRYVNAPVTGFDSTDTITSIAVVAKF